MKKLFLIGVAALLAMILTTANSSAQENHPYAGELVGGLPATIPANTTTNLATPVFIDWSKQQYGGLEADTAWSTAGNSTGLTNLVFTLAPSVSGNSPGDTNQTVAFTAGNYTAKGTYSMNTTNYSLNGKKGFFIISIANNSAAGVATNLLYKSTKIGYP